MLTVPCCKLSLTPFAPAYGFSLIELMIVVSILAIMLAIASPNFSTTLTVSQVKTTADTFVSTMHLARSSAIKYGQDVVLCTSDNAHTPSASCNVDVGWQNGWLLFVDTNRNRSRDNGEILLKANPVQQSRVAVNGGSNFGHYLTYSSAGNLSGNTGLSTGTITFCVIPSRMDAIINTTGRIRLQSSTVTTCP